MFCDSLEDHRLKGVSNWMPKTCDLPKNCGLSPYSQLFPEEVNHVVSKKNTPVLVLERQFGLYMNDKCLLQCRGRIQNSSLNQEEKTPMLLPSKHQVMDLIVREAHESMLHSGVNTTLTTLRARFWIM